METPRWWMTCGLLAVWTLTGCGWSEPGEEASDTDSMAELDEPDRESATSAKLASSQGNKIETLELRLKVGDRFPLVKTVEQRLKQISAAGGPPVESSSLLTLTLAIDVEEISDGIKRLGVRYQRVRYEHDIAGEKLVFDSAVPQQSVPEAASVYHGLVDNGFRFC